MPKRPSATVIVYERGNKNRLAETEGGETHVELTSSQKQTVEHQFDSFCKRVLKNEARDYYDGKKRHLAKEALFSELTQKEIDELTMTDKYPSLISKFIVQGFEVEIEDELLAEALSVLSEQSREIVLMSYFLEMNDGEISDILNMVRRTVQYQRTSSLKTIKKYMEEQANDKE